MLDSANERSVLESLVIELLGDDSNLMKILTDAVDAAEKSAKQVSAAFTRGFTDGGRAAAKAAQDFGKVTPEVEELNKTLGLFLRETEGAFQGVVRAGKMTREEFEAYRQNGLATIATEREKAQALGASTKELDAFAKRVKAATYEQKEAVIAAQRAEEEQKQLKDTIRDLTAEVATQRNIWVNRITSDEEFRASTTRLKGELMELYEAGGLTAVEMRQVTQAMAYAQRGIDSANRVASRGGLAWTAQIALANQFGQELRNLGPAGGVAASAMGLVQGSVSSLFQPVSMADVSFKNLAVTLGRFAAVTAPLAGAVAAVAGLAGLGKLTIDAAKLAQELQNATHRTGLTIEGLQELQHAARSTGVPIDMLSTTMQRLQRRAADANAGNAGLSQAFRMLGVTLTDEHGKMRTTEELLGDVADGLNRVESDADRLALAFKVFDTEGGRLLPLLTRGSEGIKELREEARALGLVVSGDAVLSLVELQEKLTTVKSQFDTLKMEVAASFLPVFTEGVIPMLQDRLVPWLQNAAEQLGVLASTLFSSSEQGDQLRNRLAALLEPLVAIGEIALVMGLAVYGGLQTLTTGVKLLVNEVRIAWADMWEDFRRGGGGGLVSAEWFRNLFGMDPLPRSPEREAEVARMRAENAAITDNFLDTLDAWATPLREHGMKVLTGGVHAGIVAGLESLIRPSSPTAKALREAGGDLAQHFGDGGGSADVKSAAQAWTERLAAELRFGLKDVEEVIALLAPAIERQAAKARYALATQGVDSKAYQDAIANLTHLEGLWNSLGDGADMAGRMAARAFEDNPGLLALGDFPSILNDASGSLSEFVAAIIRTGEAVAVELGGALGVVVDWLVDFTAEHRAAVALLKQFDDAQEAAALRTRDATNAVELMLRQGRDWATVTQFAKQYGLSLEDVAVIARRLGVALEIPVPAFTAQVTTPTLLEFLNTLRSLVPSMSDVSEAAEEAGGKIWKWLGPGLTAGVAAVKAYTDALKEAEAAELAAAEASALLDANATSLVERFGRIGQSLDPLDQAALDLAMAFSAGLIDAEGYARALEAWMQAAERVDAQARATADELAALKTAADEAAEALALEAATDAWATQSQRITDFLRVNQANFDDLREAAIAAFEAGVIGADELSEALRRVDVMEVVENLRNLASDLGGTQAIIPDFLASVGQAFEQFTAGNTTDAIATAFTAATAGVSALQDAFSDSARAGEAAFDLLIGGAAAVATFVGGPALGQAVSAIGNFLKSVIGDLTNGVEQIRQTVAEVTAGSQYLGKSLVESIAAGATSQQSRGGILGWLGFTKATLDEEAFQAGVTMAEGIARGLVGTLTSGNFEDAWKRMIDDVLINGIIEAFIATSVVQDAILEALEALREGDTAGATDAMNKVRADFEYIWEQIQAIRGEAEELALDVSGALASGFTNALQSSSWEDAWAAATDSMRATLRDSIVQAFLESAAMKSIFDAFNAALEDALSDGIITDAELKKLEALYGQAEGPLKELWDALAALGLGFEDLTETVSSVTSSLQNVPQVFKDTMAAFDATAGAGGNVTPSWYRGPNDNVADIGVPDRTTITIQGDVYGYEDFEAKVQAAVGRADWRAGLSTHGVPRVG